MSAGRPEGAAPARSRRRASDPWWSDPRFLGLAAVVLALPFALRHQYARFDVETDFLWEYAPHAARIMRGELPASFPYRGPGYHLLLALIGLVARDLFLAGKLLSLAALGLMAGATASAARRAWGAEGAPAAALLLVAQPLIFVFGWSVGTDMVFAALATLAIVLLIPPEDGPPEPTARRLAAAGLLAGYAWLIRPNGLFLLPAGLTAIGLLARGSRRGRPIVIPVALFAGAFLLPTVAWLLVYHAAHGHWPVTYNYRNLAAATLPEMRVMTPDVYQKTFETEIRSVGELLRRRGFTLALQTLRNAPIYLARFGADVMGPVALAALAGLAGYPRRRAGAAASVQKGEAVSLTGGVPQATAARKWSLPLAGAWAFLILAPLYYESRFGLFLAAPAAFLGAALVKPRAAGGSTARLAPLWPRAAVALIALAGLVLGWRAAAEQLGRESFIAPIYEAGRALKAMPDPPGGVCARKPHIAWVSGRPLVGFPDTDLASLPDSLRARGAAWLYYGPVELELLPQYAGLMRPETIPAGLTLVRARGTIPFGLLFRVESVDAPASLAAGLADSLGAINAALESAGIWKRIEQRLATDAWHQGLFLLSRGRFAEAVTALQTAVRNEPDASEARFRLGQALLECGRYEESLASLEESRRLGLDSPELNRDIGRARLALKRFPGAREALRRSLDLDDRQGLTRFFLGLAEAELGRFDEADRLLTESLRHGVEDDANFQAARARILIQQDRVVEAGEILDLALRRWPAVPDLLLLRGFAAQQLGRRDEARGWYEKARQAAPDDPRPAFYLQTLR